MKRIHDQKWWLELNGWQYKRFPNEKKPDNISNWTDATANCKDEKARYHLIEPRVDSKKIIRALITTVKCEYLNQNFVSIATKIKKEYGKIASCILEAIKVEKNGPENIDEIANEVALKYKSIDAHYVKRFYCDFLTYLYSNFTEIIQDQKISSTSTIWRGFTKMICTSDRKGEQYSKALGNLRLFKPIDECSIDMLFIVSFPPGTPETKAFENKFLAGFSRSISRQNMDRDARLAVAWLQRMSTKDRHSEIFKVSFVFLFVFY